ncbi:MAG: WD40/YVTN/BNR-like repeat-containing protein [Candidatus Rokuibacteriota bacterium]
MFGLVLPVSANHVVMHGGPFGGVVVALMPHPLEPETLYLAAFGGGVYRSVDGGRRWSTVTNGLDELTVLTLALDPVSPRVIYAGTDAGVFVSRNGGTTWRRTGAAVAHRNIRSLLVSPTRPTVLYAATDQGIQWSWDGGVTWAPRSAGITSSDVRVLRIDPARPARFFAAGFGGVLRSDDEGRSWSPANRGLGDLRVRALALDPARPGVLYAGTAGRGIFETVDGADHWRPINEGLRNLTVLSLLVAGSGDRFAGTVGGVYRRPASASKWELVGEDVLTLTVTFVTNDPHRPGTVYAGTGGLVFVSEDRGRRWRELDASVDGRAAQPASDRSAAHPREEGGERR